MEPGPVPDHAHPGKHVGICCGGKRYKFEQYEHHVYFVLRVEWYAVDWVDAVHRYTYVYIYVCVCIYIYIYIYIYIVCVYT